MINIVKKQVCRKSFLFAFDKYIYFFLYLCNRLCFLVLIFPKYLNLKAEIMERLQNLDVDSMTPRDAQDFLYELKKLADAIEE